MNSKKAITLLVLATLIIGLMPLVPAQAIAIDYISVTVVQKGDEIELEGSGVPGGRTVNVYWDNVDKETFSSGSGKVASTTAKRDQTWKVKFKAPEGLTGVHYVYVKDVTSGDFTYEIVDMVPSLSFSSSSALDGDKVTITGYGFDYNDDDDEGYGVTIDFSSFGVTVTPSPTTPKTNTVGTWTASFVVPDVAYGDYDINATDGLTWAIETLTVGASITLSIKEGSTGTVVTVTGRGYEPGQTIGYAPGADGWVEIYNATWWSYCALVVDPVTVSTLGKFSAKIVIPSGMSLGDYTIYVDDDVYWAEADFEVVGLPKVKATPSYGPQGSSIVVEGWNFTKLSNTEVVVTLGGQNAKTFKTNSAGYFKATYVIPAVASMDQILLAEQDDYLIQAQSTVRVGTMLVIVNPAEGPAGTKMSITGVGFTALEDYSATIGDLDWFEGTVEHDGTIARGDVYIPSMNPGIYTITIVDEDTDIEVTTTFTVTENTYVDLDPAKAANDYTISFEGYNFAEDDMAPISIILYNASSQWDITGDLYDEEYGEDGNWTASWDVYGSDLLDLGVYMMNITDNHELFTMLTFEIVTPVVNAAPRKSSFAVGETLSFKLSSTFKEELYYIKVMDPAGNLYWRTDNFVTFVKVGTEQTVPYYSQISAGNPMIFLSDAPLGTWTYKVYNTDADVSAQGTFQVTAAASDILGQQIEDLNAAVTDLQSDITTVSTEVAAVRTQITNAINAANAAVQAANAATQAVNAVAQTANAASTAAQNAATAATEAKNAANGLTTLVYGAIGASLVAALAAIVSLMQISRRIAG